jgi:peptide/nickel transport system ATP-binding protein
MTGREFHGMMREPALLSVRELTVQHVARGATPLVDHISLVVGAERVALVGESGSGKSLTSRAIMGLLSPALRATATQLRFGDVDLLSLTPQQWRSIRGARIALAQQDPRHALNPVLTIGRQLDEMLLLHGRRSRTDRRQRVESMLEAVGLSDQVLSAYPYQLSGGMGQRAVLAMMLLNEPQLLIADEPTSALDAALRDQILELMCDLVQSQGMGLLLISHDLRQVARFCDRVLIMFRGRIVDTVRAADLAQATHPYTHALWSCRPSGLTYGSELPVPGAQWQASEQVE